MNFEVKYTPDFDHSLKRIAKKHKSIRDDILELIDQLEREPRTGIQVRTNLYKIRLNISSSNKGKVEVQGLLLMFIIPRRQFS